MTTELFLRDWRFGAIQAERLCAGLLAINGYSDVDPQAPLGGADGRKDVTARRNGMTFVAAVHFPPTTQAFHQIRAKFVRDREGVAMNGAAGFVFFVNQPLSPAQRGSLLNLGGPRDEIFHLERIRHCLDSPAGYGLRQLYLGLSMSPEEHAAQHNIKEQANPEADQQPEAAGRVLPVMGFPELGEVLMRLPEVYDGRLELDVLEGGLGQLELVLYELLRIGGRGDLVLDAEANEALVPEEHRWWTDQDPRALAVREDAGVASEFLATVETLGGVPVRGIAESIDPVVSALLEVDSWRHSPQWILSSWFPGEGTAYLAVATASLAAWTSETGSGLLVYVDGTVVDQGEGTRVAPGPLHSYLLCISRAPAGTDELAAIHRLVVSCPGEGWCRVDGCSTVARDIETEIAPLLERAVRSAGVASAAHRHAAGSVYQEMYGSGSDYGYAEGLLDILAHTLECSGWEEIERSEWEGGNEELLVRRADDFLVLEHDPVTRQILVGDGTYALNGILDLLAGEGLIAESGEHLIADISDAVETWGAGYLSAAADALSGRVDLERDPAFTSRQATLLGLHPAGLGYVTTADCDALCEAQLAGLLRAVDAELPAWVRDTDGSGSDSERVSGARSGGSVRLAPLLPMTEISREPVAGGELANLAAEIESLRESASPPALNPPEYYQVDDRLIEIWNLSAGPAVIEFTQVEVPGARAALKEKLHELVELGLDVDRLPQWQIEETSEISRIFTGYLTEDEARADGRRLLLDATIRSPDLRFMTGWERDALLLVRGLDWYTIRTRADGSISYKVNEEPLNAHMTYAEMGGRLARDVEYGPPFGDDLGPFAKKVASAFIHREAADALLAQARHSLRVTMQGIDRVEQAGGGPMNLGELARRLYTDSSELVNLRLARRPR
ncbi:hypothetical protein [Kribbella soli]|uniref:Uncharacterized protein n=1 Tax=Kribbella soli TaxID=1124743 RepID=A0A4R0HBM5_9ACTN|nr:hypothetical protein [Kribbella soli]TCC08397.1 hypothetical protein E0H45_21165 [Kribbella soli]